MEAIKIENISKNYGNIIALDNVSIDINQNELFGLLGVNGAGKSTLIKLIASIISPSSGKILCFGKDTIKDTLFVKQIVDFSPQETAVCEKLSVEENLSFISRLYGESKKESKEHVEQIINDFGLESVRKQKANTLSGGYQRRLSIAMALITNPKILMLDEPTLGLDVLARRELWKIIKNLKKKVTIVLTTHYLEEAEHLCDRICILVKGKVLVTDTLDNLLIKGKSEKFEDAFVNIVEGALNE